MTSVLRELWLFVREERKWWLLPLLAVLGVVGLVAIGAALHPALAPLLYPLA